MKQTIVSAVKVDGKGVVVTFNGDAVECMEAVGMVLASAAANMAEGGMPVEDIRKQIGICVDFGMKYGLERAKEV